LTLADICLIYARPSKHVVQALHDILSQKYSVWWDQDIHAGDYREEIERQLKRAGCVIPIWCQASRANPNVRDEAAYARKFHVPLLPVKIERVDIPIGFGGLQTVDLIGWNGDPADKRIQDLFRGIESTLLIRPKVLNIGEKHLELPFFFRSVSSHETALRPAAAVHALTLFRSSALLVSAYDIINEEEEQRGQMIAGLDSCKAAGDIVLLDSGNYEAYRKRDRTWNADRFHEALKITPHDIALSFDNPHPPPNVDGMVAGVLNSVGDDMRHTDKPVLPIIHIPQNASHEMVLEIIPEVMKRICQKLRPIAIAIPERELGDGILTRARAVYVIRAALDELGFYQPLHLLGTGNPLTIAVLAAVGADLFDGLEWCRTVADSETGHLFHLQHYEFFSWQDKLALSPIVQQAVTTEKVAYSAKVAFHNLEFFSTWMTELREHVLSGKIDRFLTSKLPGGVETMRLLEKVVPEVFE
jgi:queuine/archaeosine tRNA-ribosyltransferase